MTALAPWETVDEPVESHRPIALVDLLDRVLGGGVVLAGEVTLAIEGVDLAHISLRALIASIGTLGPKSDE
jgi:hypothetical protein